MKNLAFVETFDGKCNLIIIIVFLHTFSNESNRLLNCDHVLTDQEVSVVVGHFGSSRNKVHIVATLPGEPAGSEHCCSLQQLAL